MTPQLIGYLPKVRTRRPEWLKGPNVEEICSVSYCIAHAPPGWIDRWLHNELGFYDQPDLAWSVVPDESRHDYSLFAYKLFPVYFERGEQRLVELPVLSVEPLPACFSRLGCDVVSRSVGIYFECSPLSCNGLAEGYAVNRYCLADTEAEGLVMAQEFSLSEPEPGPYYLIEVWRSDVESVIPG